MPTVAFGSTTLVNPSSRAAVKATVHPVVSHELIGQMINDHLRAMPRDAMH